MNKKNLTRNIFIGLIAGFIVGVGLSFFKDVPFIADVIIAKVLPIAGDLFMNALKMMVVPLVLVSIVCGVTALDDVRKLGRIGIKTVGFYLTTTLLALIIGLTIAIILDPGQGVEIANLTQGEVTLSEPKTLFETFMAIIPTNPFKALVEGDMLQVIFMAVMIGLGIITIPTKTVKIKEFFDESNDLIMTLVGYVMAFAPIGIFSLIASTFATMGLSIIGSLFSYFIAIVLALIIHFVVVYLGALKYIAKLSPKIFVKKFAKVMSVGFSTSSSSATLTENLAVCEEDLGIHSDICSFTLPLGATINMDGTAIMQGVAVIFLASVYGIELTLVQLGTVVVVATVASIGTAGVPGVGLVMLSLVLESVGIPVEGIALIIGVDRIIDMLRTVVNISGDAVCSIIVAKSEDEFDEEVYLR